MADNHQLADGNNDDDIFVYMGVGQQVPRDVRRAKIGESVDTIPARAFENCSQLTEVEGHDKLKKIEVSAFNDCRSLIRLIHMNGVKEIGTCAFNCCRSLADIDFDKLEIIGYDAFDSCRSLRSINLPSIRRIGKCALSWCTSLTEAVFGKDLERIEGCALYKCTSLGRIAIPLIDGLIIEDDAIPGCDILSRVDIVGEGIHKTISSFHMESWRGEMKEEIDRINQTLPEISPNEKTTTIRQWIRSVLDKVEHYKTEHKVLVKEAMTLLELALWKAKLLNEEGMQCKAEEEKKSKKARIDKESTRVEHRVTCGANIFIKNVLPFLVLK